ncbi:hypothetical protein BGZ70_009623 [Mortierella alpina]|uniref:Thioredoxin domain-containing protein n=1 Tax=Mortierella alpina TaxID=64518 RepID=A0A9P6J1G7_MORAP|nr:hypothetical protein BGZ70_009623 [Mortierella alpina]
MPVAIIASVEEYQEVLSKSEASKLVDVDQFEKLADEAEVTAMPTFQFHRANQKIAELKGDEASDLKALIEEHQALTK